MSTAPSPADLAARSGRATAPKRPGPRFPLERPVVFLDTETTSLAQDRRIWDLAMIRRDVDHTEQTFAAYIRDVDLANADPKALEIGRFRDRYPRSVGTTPAFDVARKVMDWTWGATIVGANPAFDMEGLTALLRRHRLAPMWHYRPIDVEALTAGHLGRHPGGLNACARALGIDVDTAGEHTALGDTEVARAIHDYILGGAR